MRKLLNLKILTPTTDQNESGKNGKTKAMQKRKRMSGENYTGVC